MADSSHDGDIFTIGPVENQFTYKKIMDGLWQCCRGLLTTDVPSATNPPLWMCRPKPCVSQSEPHLQRLVGGRRAAVGASAAGR